MSDQSSFGQLGALERVVISRFNWAGLGVAAPLEAHPPQRPRRDLCVPLSEVGEELTVLWREDGLGRVVGERQSAPALGWDQLGCEQALRCPGCTLRQLSESRRLEAQVESHCAALERLCPGALTQAALLRPQSVPKDDYRARLYARLFHPAEPNSRLITGMWARWGEAIELGRCPVQTAGSRGLLQLLRAHAEDQAWPKAIEGLTVQAMGAELEGVVTIHARGVASAELIERLGLSALPPELMTRVGFYLSLLPVNAPRRAEAQLSWLCGAERLTWRCEEGFTWRVALPAWLPQSPRSVGVLRRLIWSALACREGAQVFELGCGVGTVSLWLMTRGLSVWGAELDARSVEALRATHKELITSGGAELEAEAEAEGPQLLPAEGWGELKAEVIDGRRGLARAAQEGARFDRLLIHAMRSPITGLLPLAAHLKIPQLCYVAPSMPSLARDLAEEPRYQLTELRWLDQTPGSAQLLTVATLKLAHERSPTSAPER